MTWEIFLPVFFAGIMALAIIIYAVLDGYDLGIGMQLDFSHEQSLTDRNTLIDSIGPFWDANETWLVLSVGVLLIAFPSVHSMVFHALYLPTFVMLIALIIRGVAFEFRIKAADNYRLMWDKLFKISSWLIALSQGFMLGMFVMGLEYTWQAVVFASLSALGVAFAYNYIGALWLLLKTSNDLQQTAIKHALVYGRFAAVGIALVCLINPWVNPDVFARWFSSWNWLYLSPIPLICFALFVYNEKLLRQAKSQQLKKEWLPVLNAALIFLCCFQGISVSFYPYLIPGEITFWAAASDVVSLKFVFYGVALVVPCILFYTAFVYKIFWGKVDAT